MATATDPGALRANPTSRAIDIGVDRDRQIIFGVIIAEEGPFRDGRGEFDAAGIRAIRDLMARVPGGLKSRFSHPTLLDDGLGKFLGRMQSPRLVTVWRGGKQVSAVRADLHLSDTAFEGNPNGNLGDYLLDLAEEDPEALGASLVLNSDQEYRLDARGRRLLGDNGEPLPPLWKPTKLYGCDVVDEGVATCEFLGFTSTTSARDFEEYMTGLLDRAFPPGTSREAVESRCRGWIGKYLEWKHPEADGYDPERDPKLRRERFHREHPEAERLLHPVPPPAFRAGDEPGLLPAIVEGLAAPFGQVVQEADGTMSHYCA
ncbi:MAG: hypothetical protein NTW96_24695, partial [Planctomycetia bacterium]|nr:hypothetical protein [Planctomycetia bacterium]